MKIAIVDDEKTYREELEKYLREYDSEDNFTIMKFEDGDEFFQENISDFDIAFLDIEMPNIDGITLASEVIKKNPNIFLIYVTNHSSYVSKAIRNHAFQFLPKPVNKEDLYIELDRVKNVLQKRDFRLKIQSNGTDYFLNVQNILYIVSFNKSVEIYMNDGLSYITAVKLSTLALNLKKYNFIQSHKSYLVNLRYAYSVGRDDIELIYEKMRVPISRNYRFEFKKELNRFINGVT